MTQKLQPMTATEVSFRLAQRGIYASRDRIARMSDALWGREPHEAGRHRKFSDAMIDELALSMQLIERGMTRAQIVEIMRDPSQAADRILSDTEELVRELRRLEEVQAIGA